jgi:hypothetical protein
MISEIDHGLEIIYIKIMNLNNYSQELRNQNTNQVYTTNKMVAELESYIEFIKNELHYLDEEIRRNDEIRKKILEKLEGN